MSAGEHIFFTYGEAGSTIAAIDAAGGELTDLVEPAAFYTDLTLSPDGQRIAFVRIMDSDDRGDIFMMAVDGSGLTRLVDTPSYDTDLQWSPDGENLAFASTPDAEADCAQICPFDLYVVNIASGKVNRLTTNTEPDTSPVWSPDGTRIAFVRGCDVPSIERCRQQVHVMNVDGSMERNLTPKANASDPVWLADGQQVAFVVTSTSEKAIYASSPTGTEAQRLALLQPNEYLRDWSPDRERVLFMRQKGVCQVEDCTRQLYSMRPNGADVRQLTSAEDLASEPAWSPDGTRIAFALTRNDRSFVSIMNDDGSGIRELLEVDPGLSELVWSPR